LPPNDDPYPKTVEEYMTRVVPAARARASAIPGVIGAALLLVGLAGCPGSLDPSLLDASGGGGTVNVAPIFAKYTCAAPNACHDANGTAANFDMATTGWEMKLVGTNPKGGGTSVCASNGPYLDPGSNPATGLFMTKLKGGTGLVCGVRMPQVGGTLSAGEIAMVQQWANALVMAAGSGGNTDGGGGQ
jgi:hypothetical protein